MTDARAQTTRAGSGTLRASASSVAWIALAAAVTVASMALALGGEPADVFGTAARLGLLPTLDESGPRLGPISPRIVDDLLGIRRSKQLLEPSTPDSQTTQPQRAPQRVPGPRLPAKAGDRPTGSPAAVVTDVSIQIAVDETEARPGEVLTYQIDLVNEGSRTAPRTTVTSHVPEHTVLVGDVSCDGLPASVAPGDGTLDPEICLNLFGPQPGEEHPIRVTVANLPPGARRSFVFRVAIDPATPPDTVISNHAHVDGGAIPSKTTYDVSTRVVVLP